MSLRIFLTELQLMHSCLSHLLAQPVTTSDFQSPPRPLCLHPGSVVALPATLQSPSPCRTAPPWVTPPSSFVLDDLRRYSVDLRYTVSQTTGSVPISTVIISEASGSRTILHAYKFVHLSAPCKLPPPSLNPRTGLFSQKRGALTHMLQNPSLPQWKVQATCRL